MKQTHILPQIPQGITDSVVEKYLRDLQKVIRDKHEDDYMSSKKGGGGIDALTASVSEAKAGVDNTKVITPYGLRQALNAEGSAPVYACRAWVYFHGQTCQIYAGGNINSITDNGSGDYTINFINSMLDGNYSFAFEGYAGGAHYQILSAAGPGMIKNASSFRFQCGWVSTLSGALTNQDAQLASILIFR